MTQRYLIAHAIVIALMQKLEGQINANQFDELVQVVEDVLSKEDL